MFCPGKVSDCRQHFAAHQGVFGFIGRDCCARGAEVGSIFDRSFYQAKLGPHQRQLYLLARILPAEIAYQTRETARTPRIIRIDITDAFLAVAGVTLA